MSSDELKECLVEIINYLRDYYLDWQDYIERFSFPRMDYYYLIINISSFYNVLDICVDRLNNFDEENTIIKLFYILKSLPMKVKFDSDIYNNILFINKAIDYNNKILEENEKYKKTD